MVAKWKKAIGPDNMPTDVFKCTAEASSKTPEAMFQTMWAYQIVPRILRKTFV
jgi:hypothetical protein